MVYSPIKEMRPHNLSFSGLQYPWDLGTIEDIWKDHRGGIDDRRMVSTYGVHVENVHLTHGATQVSACLCNISRRKVAVEMPSYGPLSQTARILGLETIVVEKPLQVRGLSIVKSGHRFYPKSTF